MSKFRFSRNLNEKAYLLGLRTGDLHARKKYNRIIVEMTTTKKAQINMFKKVFGKYSNVKVYEKKGGYTEKTNRVYCPLDVSFIFLIKKPESVPEWVLKNNSFFYSFLCGYCDSEGSWILTYHKKYTGKWKDLIFSLGTCDKKILEQIHQKLRELNFNSHLYLVRKKGIYDGRKCNLDLYRVMIMTHKDVIKLAKELLPLSMHEDKIEAKLRLIDYYEKNEKEKILKRNELGTVKISCIKCGHKKLWKNGFDEYKDKKQQYYKCPMCKAEFSTSTIVKEKVV